MSVVSGDVFPKKNFFGVENIFKLYKEETSFEGYWLAPGGREASFIINLGCQKRFDVIKLVNTHNQKVRDRSTKKFRYTYAGKTKQIS